MQISKDNINEVIESLMPFVDRRVKSFLRKQPTHNHLQDDLKSAGYLALVVELQKLIGQPEKQNAGYYSAIIRSALNECCRLEQTIVPPKQFIKEVAEFFPDRKPLFDEHVNDDPNFVETDFVDQLNPTEKEIVSLKSQGLNASDIATQLDMDIRSVRATIKEIKSKLTPERFNMSPSEYVNDLFTDHSPPLERMLGLALRIMSTFDPIPFTPDNINGGNPVTELLSRLRAIEGGKDTQCFQQIRLIFNDRQQKYARKPIQ